VEVQGNTLIVKWWEVILFFYAYYRSATNAPLCDWTLQAVSMLYVNLGFVTATTGAELHRTISPSKWQQQKEKSDICVVKKKRKKCL